MRYRSNIYEFSQAARKYLAVLLMLYPVSIFASVIADMLSACNLNNENIYNV